MFIIHGFNSRIGCSVEYFDLEYALRLWDSILVDDGLLLGEWYCNSKNNDKNVKGYSIYSQITGSCWFDYGKKIDAFETTLVTVR